MELMATTTTTSCSKRLELMGFTSVWRAAQRWGKEGWVLKADSKREILV